jgi:alkanesulfonate monooxygenase SsuD/methylene tetrahydromethanopterin reductase-like flavin-dependent oxidoreductase (luciferase family)
MPEPGFSRGVAPALAESGRRSRRRRLHQHGLAADNVAESEGTVVRAARAASRNPDEVEIWQIACLDCSADGDASRRKIGAILAFVSAYVMGGGDLARRGVPAEHRAALLELRRRYSTRPGDADAALVTELGLFDYLSRRLAICGTPDECLAQVLAARAAGVRRLMFSVSLAVDPLATVRLFGEKVLPAVRS